MWVGILLGRKFYHHKRKKTKLIQTFQMSIISLLIQKYFLLLEISILI